MTQLLRCRLWRVETQRWRLRVSYSLTCSTRYPVALIRSPFFRLAFFQIRHSYSQLSSQSPVKWPLFTLLHCNTSSKRILYLHSIFSNWFVSQVLCSYLVKRRNISKELLFPEHRENNHRDHINIAILCKTIIRIIS